MNRILITGVRGKTGEPLARLLAAQAGVDVAGGSRRPSAVDIAGIRSVAFSWDDPDGWVPAARDIDAVYLVRPDRPDAPTLIEAFLAGVSPRTRVVLLSEQDADYAGPDGWAPQAERAVRESGCPWTILRPSWFMQVFTDPRFYRDAILEAGELAFPGGGASVAWIDARDIAAAAARTLLDSGHTGQVYELTGPESLSLPHTAEVLSSVTGRRVSYRELTIDQAVNGMQGFDRELSILTFQRVRDGSFATATDTVERLTGRPARTLASLLG